MAGCPSGAGFFVAVRRPADFKTMPQRMVQPKTCARHIPRQSP